MTAYRSAAGKVVLLASSYPAYATYNWSMLFDNNADKVYFMDTLNTPIASMNWLYILIVLKTYGSVELTKHQGTHEWFKLCCFGITSTTANIVLSGDINQ